MAQRKNRDVVILVRVTKEEKTLFRKLAADRHTDISEIIRQILHREVAQEVPR
jgi:hypothetical protein